MNKMQRPRVQRGFMLPLCLLFSAAIAMLAQAQLQAALLTRQQVININQASAIDIRLIDQTHPPGAVDDQLLACCG
jgi:hypothetical protein